MAFEDRGFVFEAETFFALLYNIILIVVCNQLLNNAN